MTLAPEESVRSPWITVWFSPRQTIDYLVATRPTYFVWVIAILGAVASIYEQLVLASAARPLADWRLALGFVVLSAASGIAWLYISAWILSWIGRLLGGQASPMQIRTAYAWSMPPVILGAVISLAICWAAKDNAIRPNVITWLATIFPLWSIVIFLLMFGRVQRFGFWRTIGVYVLNLAGVSLAVALLIRTLLYQPFNIPASSMRPTLLVGDYIFVSKFAYGYSRFSLPFSPPLISGRIFASEPSRGDVVVFRLTQQNTDYVKRVVGLPGDRVQMKEGQLYINDMPVKREDARADVADGDACGPAPKEKIKRWRETLPNGASYETIDCLENGPFDNTNVYTIPPGHFFVLGDNRDNSTDSRVKSIGLVPFENLIGRVSVIYFSREAGDAGAMPQVRSDRIGAVVR